MNPPLRHRWGLWIDRAGWGLIPLALGLAGGFWFGDLGYSWLRLLELLAVGFTVAALAIILGYALRRKIIKTTPQGRVIRWRAVFSLALVFGALGLRVAIAHLDQPVAITALSIPEYRELYENDRVYLEEVAAQLEQIAQRMAQSDLASSNPDSALTADQESFLLESWTSFSDLAFSLDQIRRRWEIWYHFDLSRNERSQLIESYLLAYASELTLYENALRVDGVIQANPNLQKYLDARQGQGELTYWPYGTARQSLLGVADQSRVIVGEQYLRWLQQAFDRTDGGLLRGSLARDIQRRIETIKALQPASDLVLEQSPDLEVLKREIHRGWYPLQRSVAQWMGDTRIQRGQSYLISPTQLETMDANLEPGDILLSRKNWYLSNVGLPGFWPHAVLYLGHPQKMEAYFADPEVREWLETLRSQPRSLGEAIQRIQPEGWRIYQGSPDQNGHQVIEALGEGVLMHTLVETAGDYLAALRPRLSKKAKAQAIYEAFHHFGKPYDFDFDFATDHAIVCTELVWRSYRPRENKDGLQLEPLRLAGRSTYPANEFARLYASEFGLNHAQLEFVYFLDARESEMRAVVSDEAAFRSSYLRPKWDYFQQ